MPFLTSALVAGGLAAAGGIGGSAIAAKGAGQAANAQAQAAEQAAQLQHQDQQAALAFQQKQYDTEQQQIAPWLQAGTTAINQLSGDKLPAFQAPTAATEQNDPGYQFRLQQGQQALENSAAARGGLLSGNTGEALTQYGQNYASNEYGNVYNRAMNDYNTNVIAPYNRLSALAGIGQQAQASSAQQGQAAANNVMGIDMSAGQQQGNSLLQAGAARASGYASQGNIWGNALSGATNSIGNGILLSSLMGNRGAPKGNRGAPTEAYINPAGF